jgi:hypothetical protein
MWKRRVIAANTTGEVYPNAIVQASSVTVRLRRETGIELGRQMLCAITCQHQERGVLWI